ncbi:MAG: flavodoxin family protein [Stomatobaculum sp.]|nr:flavodoxin family protein [Stomatobaculum sp.]
MGKSIVVFRGSPRKNGNTNALTDSAVSCFREAGCSITEFDLYDMEIFPCRACRACQEDWTVVNCIQEDDFGKAAAAVQESDLILLATPIYSWYCTAPMKALLDRMVYAFNMYYGEKRGPSLWEGKQTALITTCGYRPEKGADLLEEGIRRYCKHSKLEYLGMLCERHMGYQTVFMDEDKRNHAIQFAEELLEKMR